MKTISLKTTKQEKKEGTKTVFVTVSTETKNVTKQHHQNATEKDCLQFMRRLGGTETVTRGYTSQGYFIVKVVSTSPDKQNRTIREYDFDINE
jgi:hypothetical protein